MEENYKFTKKERLHRTLDFKKVYNLGNAYHSKYLVLFALPTFNMTKRIGFTVGKKVGNAVKRNRVKRLLREVYRLNKNNLIYNGIDMIVVAKRNSFELKFKEIETELLRLFKRAGLVKDDNKREFTLIN